MSSRSAEDDVAIGLMRWWEKVHPNFRLIVTHTRVTGGSEPGTHHQRIPDLLEPLFDSLANTSVFVAGSPEFVDDCVAQAKALGATDDLIHTEGHNSQLTPTP